MGQCPGLSPQERGAPVRLLIREEWMVELQLCWKLQSSFGRVPFSLAISLLITPLAMLTVCCVELARVPHLFLTANAWTSPKPVSVLM